MCIQTPLIIRSLLSNDLRRYHGLPFICNLFPHILSNLSNSSKDNYFQLQIHHVEINSRIFQNENGSSKQKLLTSAVSRMTLKQMNIHTYIRFWYQSRVLIRQLLIYTSYKFCVQVKKNALCITNLMYCDFKKFGRLPTSWKYWLVNLKLIFI